MLYLLADVAPAAEAASKDPGAGALLVLVLAALMLWALLKSPGGGQPTPPPPPEPPPEFQEITPVDHNVTPPGGAFGAADGTTNMAIKVRRVIVLPPTSDRTERQPRN